MTDTISDFKVGDTISLAGTVLLPAGDWVTNQPTGWLRSNGTKVATLTVTLAALVPTTAEATHTVSVELDAALCAGLNHGRHSTDIRFHDATGLVMHSPTYIIDLQKAETGVPA